MTKTRNEIKIPDYKIYEKFGGQDGYEFVAMLAIRLVYALEEIADNLKERSENDKS